MNRNFGKENMEPQQPTEQNDHYGGQNAEQHGGYNRRVVQHGEEGDASGTERAVTHYANPGNYPTNDNTTASRRYTISAAPGEGANVVTERHGTQPPHPRAGSMAGVGGDLMGNHSQRSIPGQSHHPGYREIPGTPGQVPGYEQPLSPNHFAHRMSLGQFYPMSAGGASPSYPVTEMGDLSGRGGGGASSTGAQSAAAPGASASAPSNNAGGNTRDQQQGGAQSSTAPAPGGLSQADHEEELLLNLLITRRQRSRMAGGNSKGGAGGQPQLSLADEIMRMRQQRAPVPGMPPLYADQQQTLPNAPPYQEYRVIKQEGGGGGYGAPPASAAPYHPHHPHVGHFPAHPHSMRAPPMHGGGGEMDRIDRSPGRFHTMDARMDMRDFSERSGAVGGYKQHQQHRYMAAHHHHHGGAPPMGYDMYAVDMALAAAATDAPPPPKKKRAHKKKPADMPRRPLSAYNLFFSEERERILKEIEKGEGKGGDGAVKTEDNNDSDSPAKEEKQIDKPKALLRPLIPSQKKRRPHRKTHGKISFQDLARMVGERWKNLPDDDRKYYQDLAQEDMKRQKAAMEEYYAKQNNEKTAGVATTTGDNNGATATAGMATVDA